MTLTAWHHRLQEHFTALRLRRSTTAPGRPIFVLEHGLDEVETQALVNELRDEVAVGDPSPQHWLVWVVYAAEVGYRYEGDEYWQTFDRHTPGWRYGYRDLIKYWFLRFCTDYGGAKPVGAWAEHFRIICWPITHAILPQDLQEQLARILYEMRHSFRPELFESPELLGGQIRARSLNTSTRFQQLAQEALLLGQIAAALLLPERALSEELILRATLQRIARDLGRETAARRWLAEARSHAGRLSVTGLRRGSGTTPGGEASRADAGAPEVEPQFILRPTSNGRWEAILEIPDFAGLTARHVELTDILSNSRCFVAGSAGRPLARGRVMSQRQQVVLREWPALGEPLLRFEPSTELLNLLLRTSCMLRPGPVWVFKVGSDGLAYGLRSRVVRAAHKYVVLSKDVIGTAGVLEAITLECNGIHGASIELPPAIQEPLAKELQRIGLEQAKSIEVWPAGVPPVNWDGEGRAEWLSSDTPCIGIRADHTVRALWLSVNDQAAERVECSDDKLAAGVFVELPRLPLGVHKLTASIRPWSEQDAVIGELDVVIREPRSWNPSRGNRGGVFQIAVDPVRPSLEALWEGRASIEIQGPASRTVKSTIRFFEKDDKLPIISKILSRIQMPLRASTWLSLLESQLHRDTSIQHAYDLASRCEITFDAEDFGASVLTCERRFSPLRWVVRRDQQGYRLRLVDDSGSDAKPRVYLYAFENPQQGIPVAFDFNAKEHEVPLPGGLYLASAGSAEVSIIVPPRVTTLADLRIRTRVEAHGRPQNRVRDLVVVFEMWSRARVTGDVVSMGVRYHVLSEIMTELVRTVCGGEWLDAEEAYYRGALEKESLAIAVSRDATEQRCLGLEILKKMGDLADRSAEDRIQPFALSLTQCLKFAGGGRSYVDATGKVRRDPPPAPERPGWIAEFALRFASDPSRLRLWSRGDFAGLVEALLSRPVVARAARLLVVAGRKQGGPRSGENRLYSDWDWL